MKMKSLLLVVCLTASVLAGPHAVRKDNPDERGPYFQGDIRGPLPPMDKNGLVSTYYRWLAGVVPFVFNDTITAEQETAIRAAMADYETLTNGCIRFVEYDDERDIDYIRFINEEDSCWSYVGCVHYEQDLNMATWCTDYGTIMHELLHALGFGHEQCTPNRDDYVTIMWDNIEEGEASNFHKYSDSVLTDFGFPYDYESVLHYSAYKYSANGEMTIVTKDPDYQFVIGQREGLSEIDLGKLLAMYHCPDSN